MIAMAVLLWMRPRPVLVIGIAIVLLAPLATLPLLHETGTLALLRTFTVLPGPLRDGVEIVVYAFVPWLGVMCLGFGYGHVFRMPKEARDRVIGWTGVGALVVFGVLRGLNGYGDLSPWKNWPDLTRDVESFLNLTKYPPSPDYVLATLGFSLLIFLGINRLHETISRPLTKFGRTPCLPTSHTFSDCIRCRSRWDCRWAFHFVFSELHGHCRWSDVRQWQLA